jgi:hypothetical protein
MLPNLKIKVDMKIEVKITDEAGNVQQYVVSGSLLSDEEIEEYAKSVYGEKVEHWKRITNSFIVGAKWARDVLKTRQRNVR